MPNFYRDCEDLRFRMERVPWDEIVPLVEVGFRDAGTHDMAPGSVEDARETYAMVLDLVGEVAAETIAPRAAEVDAEGCRLENGVVHYAKATREQLDQLAEMGLLGFTLPRRHGGMNLPMTLYTASVEMIARADAALMTLYALQGCGETLNRFGSDELKDRYLPAIASGKATCAMLLSEPNAGSDLPNVATKATPIDEAAGLWSIEGQKCWCTNGGADLLFVLARSEPGTDDARGLSLFLVERSERVSVTKLEEKLGIHGSPTAVVNFDGAEARLIGERRRGLTTYTMKLIHATRLEVAAQAIGIAQAALAQAVRYASERSQFGRTIDSFGPVREMLMEAEAEIQASRAIVYDTAQVVDRAQGVAACLEAGLWGGEERAAKEKELKRLRRLETLLTPLAKYFAPEMANRVAYDMLQVHGGYGYVREYPAERHARDARITTIYEGTSQIQVGGVVVFFVRGGVPTLFDPVRAALRDVPGSFHDLHALLEEGYGRLEAAARYLDETDDKYYTRLCAEPLCRLIVLLYAGYRLLGDAIEGDERKAIVARHFILGVRHRVLGDGERIVGGSRLAHDGFEAVIGPYR